jgi:hypothetical protein
VGNFKLLDSYDFFKFCGRSYWIIGVNHSQKTTPSSVRIFSKFTLGTAMIFDGNASYNKFQNAQNIDSSKAILNLKRAVIE